LWQEFLDAASSGTLHKQWLDCNLYSSRYASLIPHPYHTYNRTQAVNLVNSTTTYEYDLRTRTYLQPKFSFQTLQRLRTVNLTALTGLTTTKKLVLEKREVPLGTSLADLIGVALKEAPLSPIILEALMAELSIQTK